MHQLQSHHRLSTTKRIKRTYRTEKQPKNLWACLVLSSFVLLLTVWLSAVTYYVVTIMMSSSPNDVILEEERSSSSSVQSVLFNNERRPPLPPSEQVPLVALSDDGKSNNNTIRNNNFLRQNHNIPSNNTTIQSQNNNQPIKPKLLSRNPKVIVTSSTRGNLGPPTVLNQDPPGTDWIKDRWQAASDMHGTAIKGSHWVLLDFSQMLLDEDIDEDRTNGNVDEVVNGRSGIQMTKIVLDWETAFATDYRIEGRMDRPLQHDLNVNGVETEEEEWCVLYDGGKRANSIKRNNKLQEQEQDGIDFHESEYGQSPGVKQKLPLHILHTIEWTTKSSPNNNEQSITKVNDDRESSGSSCQSTTSLFRYLRVFIRKPARGWGVSLWQVDVYGTWYNQ